jgi:hypothetical protein
VEPARDGHAELIEHEQSERDPSDPDRDSGQPDEQRPVIDPGERHPVIIAARDDGFATDSIPTSRAGRTA